MDTNVDTYMGTCRTHVWTHIRTHTNTSQAGADGMPVAIRISPGINLTRFDAVGNPLLSSLRHHVPKHV